jgi:uncharacterized membrane protein
VGKSQSGGDREHTASQQVGLGKLTAAALAFLLAGGVLLDMDRIAAVRETLDRVAHVAAIEAAASPRSADRQVICRKRFDKTVWTETEVAVDDVIVSVEEAAGVRTSTVEYDATVKLAVGRFFGFNEVTISGEAEVPAPNKQVVTATP